MRDVKVLLLMPLLTVMLMESCSMFLTYVSFGFYNVILGDLLRNGRIFRCVGVMGELSPSG
jgi:hypothetical protein